MDIFSVLSLLGGLALFLFGMNLMGTALEKISGGKMERTLEKLSGTTVKGIALGAGVTAIIQSSSATTVMVVGFVNSGIMKLVQATGIIMGANIGTTITAWILSLVGVEGDSILLKLCKPESFSAVFALVGIILLTMTKRGRKKDIGTAMLGFAVLMFGMNAMSAAVKPLANDPAFAELMIVFTNPILAMLIGAVITAIIQSSSASVGILQALSVTGTISYSMAVPIILGQNIGTCVTALISCMGANKDAKRTAMIHLYIKIIGSILFIAIYYILKVIFRDFFAQSIDAIGIATVHTLFNLLNTVVLLPFIKQLVHLAEITIKDKNQEETKTFLDERFLKTPSVAIEQCRKMTINMAQLARKNMFDAFKIIDAYDADLAVQIEKDEKKLDEYEDKLGSYLVKLSSKALSEIDSEEISTLLHTIGDFERIGDHALNILESVEEMKDKKITFSQEAQKELKVLVGALMEIINLTVDSFSNADADMASRVEPLEQVIDELKETIRARHIARLKDGRCTIELGFVLSDLLGDMERVSDHCSNIAVCVIRVREMVLDPHDYLGKIKGGEGTFKALYKEYVEKYPLEIMAAE